MNTEKEEPTEEEMKNRGRKLVDTFRLKRDPDHNDRYITLEGTKTLIGLYRTASAILDGKY